MYISCLTGWQARRFRGIEIIVLTKEFVQGKVTQGRARQALPDTDGVTESVDPVKL